MKNEPTQNHVLTEDIIEILKNPKLSCDKKTIVNYFKSFDKTSYEFIGTSKLIQIHLTDFSIFCVDQTSGAAWGSFYLWSEDVSQYAFHLENLIFILF